MNAGGCIYICRRFRGGDLMMLKIGMVVCTRTRYNQESKCIFYIAVEIIIVGAKEMSTAEKVIIFYL